MKGAVRLGCVCFAMLFGVSAALGEPKPAAILIEAAAINQEQVVPPSDDIVVSPGDVITANLYVRSWSPNGEVIRAYQATIPQTAYTSGTAGGIKPINFDAALDAETENSANAFIDIDRPDFVFQGLQTVAIVDTISFDYRWLGVIVDNAQSFSCPAPDKHYYAGTVRLKVSDDAEGTFTIGFVEAEWATVIRDVDNIAIAPMEYGKLNITVPANGVVPPRITGSDPPHEAVVAASPENTRAASIEVYFNVEVPDMTSANFAIEDGSANPPRVAKAAPSGKSVTLTLDRPLRPGAWTKVTHTPSRTRTRIGCLPGDVNGDGVLTSADLIALITAPAQTTNPLAAYQVDINGDGSFNVIDALTLIDIFNGPKVYRQALK